MIIASHHTMDLSFHRTILHKFKESQTWLQQFPLRHSDGSVIDLCQLINDNNKPQQLHPAIPSRYCYKFNEQYQHDAKWSDLCNHINESLPGATYINVRGKKKNAMNTQYRLKCNRHLMYNDDKKSFQDGHLTQEGVTTVSVKRRSKSDTGTYSSFDKMMSKTEKKKSTNAKKSKASVQCQSRRTSSGRATSEDNRCQSVIAVAQLHDGYFYLDRQNTNLNHNGHCFIPPSATKLGIDDLSDASNALVQKLADIGVRPTQIAMLLDQMDEKDGHYDPKTVSNLISKHDMIKDKSMGITHDMSSAERCMKYLDE